MTDFVWLANPDTGAPWRCPADALDAWTARGWTPCDEPLPIDPAIAERPTEPDPGPADGDAVAATETAVEIPADTATKTSRKTKE